MPSNHPTILERQQLFCEFLMRQASGLWLNSFYASLLVSSDLHIYPTILLVLDKKRIGKNDLVIDVRLDNIWIISPKLNQFLNRFEIAFLSDRYEWIPYHKTHKKSWKSILLQRIISKKQYYCRSLKQRISPFFLFPSENETQQSELVINPRRFLLFLPSIHHFLPLLLF